MFRMSDSMLEKLDCHICSEELCNDSATAPSHWWLLPLLLLGAACLPRGYLFFRRLWKEAWFEKRLGPPDGGSSGRREDDDIPPSSGREPGGPTTTTNPVAVTGGGQELPPIGGGVSNRPPV